LDVEAVASGGEASPAWRRAVGAVWADILDRMDDMVLAGAFVVRRRKICNVALPKKFGNLLNGVDHRIKILIRVEALAFVWSLWLCRNDKVFNGKNFSLGAQLFPSMVVSPAYEKSRPLYGGVYTVEGYGDEFYYPTWMTA
jgi:hypothetical protein